MGPSFMDKVLNFLRNQGEPETESLSEVVDTPAGKRGKLVEMPRMRETRIVIVEPQTFDEVQNIADQLKKGCPVIIRLGSAGRQLAKRIVDFLSGTTYALDGDFKRLGETIFLCVPSTVKLETDLDLDTDVSPELWDPLL